MAGRAAIRKSGRIGAARDATDGFQRAISCARGMEFESLRSQTDLRSRGIGIGRIMGQAAEASILVIEDNPETRDLLALVFEMKGYAVVTTGDGLDALEYLRSGGRASVIVLDVMMPNMDGVAFRRAIRADPRWADIPVVIFSAYPQPMRGESGIAGIVQKGSADIDTLIALVARAQGAFRATTSRK